MCFKKILEVLWEPEDSHGFGQLFLIFAAVLLAKFGELIFPKLTLTPWVYLGFGIMFTFYGSRLLWVSQNKKRKFPIQKENIQNTNNLQNFNISGKDKCWGRIIEIKKEYLNNSWDLSNKAFLAIFGLFFSIIIGLFVNFSKFTETNNLKLFLLIFTISFLLAIVIFIGYSTFFNKHRKQDYTKLISEIKEGRMISID